MPRPRHILDPLRAASLWLLALSVFLGLPGLGGAPALASAPAACEAACPCDAAEHAEHEAAREGQGESEHEGDEPCPDECPEDCPDCRCGLASAVVLIRIPVTSSASSDAVTRSLSHADAPANGTRDTVFRPPRFGS